MPTFRHAVTILLGAATTVLLAFPPALAAAPIEPAAAAAAAGVPAQIPPEAAPAPAAPGKLTVTVGLKGTKASNWWDIWVYPDETAPQAVLRVSAS